MDASLKWGCTKFTLLGIELSADLAAMNDFNYKAVLDKIKNSKLMEK